MKLRVAGAQLAVTLDVARNEQSVGRAVERAAAEKADVLLTPEGSLSGYTADFDQSAVAAALGRVTGLARLLGVGLALGTCFTESDGRCYNQIRLYEADGRYLGFHSKILRCGSLEDPPRGELERYAAADLRIFPFAGTVVGGLICNDLWANPGCTPAPDPHLSQQLSRLGARLVFHAVNGGRDGSLWSREVVWHFHESNLRMRAQCGRLWIATVDSAHPPDLPCSAPSGLIAPDGTWVCQAAPQGEQFFVADADLDG